MLVALTKRQHDEREHQQHTCQLSAMSSPHRHIVFSFGAELLRQNKGCALRQFTWWGSQRPKSCQLPRRQQLPCRGWTNSGAHCALLDALDEVLGYPVVFGDIVNWDTLGLKVKTHDSGAAVRHELMCTQQQVLLTSHNCLLLILPIADGLLSSTPPLQPAVMYVTFEGTGAAVCSSACG